MLYAQLHSSSASALPRARRGNKTRSQIADKIHIEHFVTLGVKLLQRPLQQRNRRRGDRFEGAATDLASQSLWHGRASGSELQRARSVAAMYCSDFGQVRQRQIDGKNQAQRSAQRGWMIGFFSFLYGKLCVVQ